MMKTGGIRYEKSISFEDTPETSKLRHLNKNRAPVQAKRKPTRFQGPEDIVETPSAKPGKLKKDKKQGANKDKNKKDKKLKKKDSRSLSDPSSVTVM